MSEEVFKGFAAQFEQSKAAAQEVAGAEVRNRREVPYRQKGITMEDYQIRDCRLHAMKIAAGLPPSLKPALVTLRYAEQLIRQAIDVEIPPQFPEDRSEAE